MARDIGTEYAITAELQIITIPIGDKGAGCTLINDGAAEIFWREIDHTLSETDIEAASAAVLVATPLFFSRLKTDSYIHKAGITIYAIRDTTTQVDSVLRVAPGRLYQSADETGNAILSTIDTTLDSILAASGGDTTGLVFSKVIIEEAAAGYKDLGLGAAGEAVRLHALVVTMKAQGTVQLHSDTNGAGAGESDLTGAIVLGAGGGINMPFNPDPRSALTSVVVEHMSLQFGTAGGDGYAIISKGAA